MKVIIKTLEKMPKHTRGKPGAGMFLHVSTHVTMDFADFCMGFPATGTSALLRGAKEYCNKRRSLCKKSNAGSREC